MEEQIQIWPPRAPIAVIALLAEPGECATQAAYLMMAMKKLKEQKAYEPLEFLPAIPGGKSGTIPCVVKAKDETCLVYSWSGPWTGSRLSGFGDWLETVRSNQLTMSAPVLLVYDHKPEAILTAANAKHGIYFEQVVCT